MLRENQRFPVVPHRALGLKGQLRGISGIFFLFLGRRVKFPVTIQELRALSKKRSLPVEFLLSLWRKARMGC